MNSKELAPVDNLMENILKCPVCFCSIGHEPKTFRSCGHTVCHQCYLIASNGKELIKCSECRTQSFVGIETNRYGHLTRNALSVNVMIKDTVEFLEENKAQLKMPSCTKCGKKEFETMCLSCVKDTEKEAVRKARPKYRYTYDETSILGKIEERLGASSRKMIKLEKAEDDKKGTESNKSTQSDASDGAGTNVDEKEECVIM